MASAVLHSPEGWELAGYRPDIAACSTIHAAPAKGSPPRPGRGRAEGPHRSKEMRMTIDLGSLWEFLMALWEFIIEYWFPVVS